MDANKDFDIDTGDITATDITAEGTLNVSGVIQQSGAADHVTINAGTSKYVKLQLPEDSNGSLSYEDDTVILHGYDIVAGAAAAVVSGTVSFGLTFDVAPIVVCAALGKHSSTSTAWPPTAGESECFAYAYNPTTTGFTYTIRRNDAGNLTSGHNYFIAYTAIGQIA